MNHFGDWFNYEASLKILVFSMLIGAALPALFALGLRLHAAGGGHTGNNGGPAQKNPVLLVIAWAIYTLVLAVIVLALLYISRDFVAHQLGQAFLGAKPK